MYRPDEAEKAKEEPDWVKSERDMFKQYRDKNDDGKLDKVDGYTVFVLLWKLALLQEEMREWIMPTDFDHSEAEARHLIYMADENKVSSNELASIAHYDLGEKKIKSF